MIEYHPLNRFMKNMFEMCRYIFLKRKIRVFLWTTNESLRLFCTTPSPSPSTALCVVRKHAYAVMFYESDELHFHPKTNIIRVYVIPVSICTGFLNLTNSVYVKCHSKYFWKVLFERDINVQKHNTSCIVTLLSLNRFCKTIVVTNAVSISRLAY